MASGARRGTKGGAEARSRSGTGTGQRKSVSAARGGGGDAAAPSGPPAKSEKQAFAHKSELETLFERWAGDPQVMREKAIHGMAEDLGLRGDDPVILMLAWKIQAMEHWRFTRGEWYHGLSSLRPTVDSQAKLQNYLHKQLRQETEAEPDKYEDFYNYVYDFVRADPAEHLELPVAKGLWKKLLVLEKDGKPLFAHLDLWIEYMETQVTGDKRVSRDLWQQLLIFARGVKSLEDFNPEDSTYPVVLDDFVEWAVEKLKQADGAPAKR
eukprot:TRINITY_DN71809_c0_g1_i1.p1 TRINITY_DN71809_c0_g1~~TRINITY_DN71809_c0_g1_i1.p1  ORF type:complete len:267 (+),score=109.25 TRINITY_DN71809_c0_g1_i1:60-860(+)